MKHFNIFFRLFVALFSIVFMLSSCSNVQPESQASTLPANAEDALYLNISVTVAPDAGYSKIAADEIAVDFPVDIQINNLSDIQITIDDTTVPLDNALRQELITPEEILAYAQIDARKGNCELKYESRNGLTYCIFTYPMYDLAIVHDILEAPDGKQHMIHTMNFDMAYRYEIGDILYLDDTTLKALDREDWGITFEIKEITPSGIAVSCAQSGGQQIGQLQIDDCFIYSYEKNDLYGFYTPSNNMIKMNSSSDFEFDWATSLGELPSGTYFVRLLISDIYDESQVHPLMRNFHDTQSYDIEFSIP